MAKQIITKRCSKCKQVKPLSDFHKNCLTKDSHCYYCKICKNKASQKYSQTKPGQIAHKTAQEHYRESKKGKTTIKHYRKSKKGKAARKHYNQTEKGKITQKKAVERYIHIHPERVKARKAVNEAVKTGILPKVTTLQCPCGNQAQHYHHHKGYAKEHRLDVISVCHKCHNKTY